MVLINLVALIPWYFLSGSIFRIFRMFHPFRFFSETGMWMYFFRRLWVAVVNLGCIHCQFFWMILLFDRSSPSVTPPHPAVFPVMAPVQDATNKAASSLNGRLRSISRDGSSVEDHQLESDAQPSNGLKKPQENGHGGPNFLVALYGCTGYGEMALKPSAGGMMLSNHVSSSGAPGAWDSNASLFTWDEDARTVLLAWAVVDVKLNKVTGASLWGVSFAVSIPFYFSPWFLAVLFISCRWGGGGGGGSLVGFTWGSW